MNERPVPSNGSSMIMALTLLLKAINNFTEVFSYGQSVSYTVDGEFINGPRKCSWHIFDGLNAFAHNERITRIEEASVREQIKSNAFTRQGIKDDDKLFRFTIPFELWNHKGYSGFPKK